MVSQNFSIGALLRFGYERFRDYLSYMLGITITFFVIGVLPSVYFSLYDTMDSETSEQLISLIFSIVQMLLTIGYIKITLLLIDGFHSEVSDLVNNVHLLLHYVVATLIFSAAVFVGMMLFIVPGVYIAIRLYFYSYFIVERQLNFWDALQQSFYMTDGHVLELLLFGLAVFGINLLGALFLGFGILFTYPVTMLATAALYQSMVNKSEVIPAPDYEPDSSF